MSGSRKRAAALAAVAVLGTGTLTAGALGAFGSTVDGTPVSALSNPALIGGVSVSAETDGLRPDAPAPTIEVRGTDHGDADKLAAQAVSDVLDFWEQTPLPKGAGLITPPVGYQSYDSTDRDAPAKCADIVVSEPNAFFCFPDRTVGWDRGHLVPMMSENFGDLAVPLVMAHEFGHVVQGLEGVGQPAMVIIAEQQSDCYAGAWSAWAAEGNSSRFTLSRRAIPNLMRALLTLSDHPNIQDVDTDHGNALERVTAWQRGWISGVDSCATITDKDVREQRAGLPGSWDVAEAKNEGNEQFTELLVGQIAKQVEAFTETPAAVTHTVKCRKSDEAAALCDGTVAYSLERLNRLATPAAAGLRGDGTAAVPLFTALVEPWVNAQEISDQDKDTARWCAVGATARWMTNPYHDVRLSAGDVGEMVLGILEMTDDDEGDAFAAVQAFNRGVHGAGLRDCLG